MSMAMLEPRAAVALGTSRPGGEFKLATQKSHTHDPLMSDLIHKIKKLKELEAGPAKS